MNLDPTLQEVWYKHACEQLTLDIVHLRRIEESAGAEQYLQEALKRVEDRFDMIDYYS